MPALPDVERQSIDPDATYVVMASRLPLHSHRHLPGFLRDTLAIRRQLAGADGLVEYGLNAQLLRKTFWTFSVWADRASLEAFAATDPHRGIVRGLSERMNPSQFEFLEVRGAEIPSDWAARMDLVR